jgi:Protein of unknown function (DUF2786).
MPAPEHILSKIKLLRNLANSPNANEAASALAMADKLIAKYNISEEELASIADQPPKYGEEELLFHSLSIVPWKQHLALACAKNFYCHIIQETLTPGVGDPEYKYYVYGEDEDVNSTKFVFHTLVKKINNLIDTKCIGRGPIYVDSYCQGVVEAVKRNIEMFGLDIPEVKVPARPMQVTTEKVLNNGTSNLSTVKAEKDKPEKESIDISKSGLIKDVMAYFKGIEDGNKLHLEDILELEAENETLKQLD